MGQVVRINPGHVGFEPGQKLIKADAYRVFLDAQTLIDDARAEAERIRAAARDAFAEEQKRGYEDGQRQAEQHMAERVHDTYVAAADYYAKVETAMIGLVTDAVRNIIGEFEEIDLVQRVVRNALTLVRNQSRVTLRVPPSQQQELHGRLDELLAGLHGISYVDIVPDGRLTEGDCVLESEVGIIEANLDTQIDALEASLKKYMAVAKRPHAEADADPGSGDAGEP